MNYEKKVSYNYIMRQGTVCFFIKGNQTLLALIEYGPNDRKWNGVGGVVDHNESPEDCVIREIKEEIDIIVHSQDLKKAFEIKDHDFLLHVFITHKWEREPLLKDKTLKELKWFPIDNLPYDQMHADNKDWLPQVLYNS